MNSLPVFAFVETKVQVALSASTGALQIFFALSLYFFFGQVATLNDLLLSLNDITNVIVPTNRDTAFGVILPVGDRPIPNPDSPPFPAPKFKSEVTFGSVLMTRAGTVSPGEFNEVSTAPSPVSVEVTGVTELLAAEEIEFPLAFVATTVNVYGVPLVKSMTVQLNAPVVQVHVLPSGLEVTV